MAANDLTKVLLSNKFKEFVKQVGVSKIETGNSEASDGKSNDGEASGNDKNDGKFMANYYEAGEEADEEVSFEAEEAE